MRLAIARTAVAVASSAGLVLGAATSAGAATARDQDHNRHHGWVKVCQDIKEHRGDHGKDRDKDKRSYHGVYKVEDSSYRAQYVNLWGNYDCDVVEVRAGNVRVSVTYEPDHTRLRGSDYRRVYVGRGEYRNVTFYYDANRHDKGGDAYSRAA